MSSAESAEVEDRLIYELGEDGWSAPQLRELLEKRMPRDHRAATIEVPFRIGTGEPAPMQVYVRRLGGLDGNAHEFLIMLEDSKP